MSTDPSAPEWADYARERNESMRRDVPPLRAVWNGQRWSERPDPSEYEDGERS